MKIRMNKREAFQLEKAKFTRIQLTSDEDAIFGKMSTQLPKDFNEHTEE